MKKIIMTMALAVTMIFGAVAPTMTAEAQVMTYGADEDELGRQIAGNVCQDFSNKLTTIGQVESVDWTTCVEYGYVDACCYITIPSFLNVGAMQTMWGQANDLHGQIIKGYMPDYQVYTQIKLIDPDTGACYYETMISFN